MASGREKQTGKRTTTEALVLGGGALHAEHDAAVDELARVVDLVAELAHSRDLVEAWCTQAGDNLARAVEDTQVLFDLERRERLAAHHGIVRVAPGVVEGDVRIVPEGGKLDHASRSCGEEEERALHLGEIILDYGMKFNHNPWILNTQATTSAAGMYVVCNISPL